MSVASTSSPQNAPEEKTSKSADKISELLSQDFVKICAVLLLLIAITVLAIFWAPIE